MAWTYIPAQNVGSEAEQPARWVDYSNPAYPLTSYTDPALGFADKNAALESLYMPMAGGNTAQMQQVIAANPDAYAQFGITPQNAAQQTDSTFYDRLHNIDNDPLANIMNPLIQGGIMGAVGAGLGNFAGLTNFGDGSWLNNLFGQPAADGITSTMASGADPTYVGGDYFVDGVRPNPLDGNNIWSGNYQYAGDPSITGVPNPTQAGGDYFFNGGSQNPLDVNNIWSGNYEYAGNPSLVGDALGTGSQPWWQGLPGTAGLEKLGTGAPYADVYNAGGGLPSWLKSLGGKLGLTGAGSDGKDGFSLSKLLGAVGPGVVGSLFENYQRDKQRDAFTELSNKWMGEGQWARDLLKQSYADPTAPLRNEFEPFLKASLDRVGNTLSMGGNPIGSGNQLQTLTNRTYLDNNELMGRYRGGLASAGYGVPYQQGSQAQMNVASLAGPGTYGIGRTLEGVNDIFNPKPTADRTLAELLKNSKINLA